MVMLFFLSIYTILLFTPHFHNFLLRTLKVYEKSFHLKKKVHSAMKFLLNCSTNLTTSEKKKNMSIIRRLSTFTNCKQQIPRGNIHWKKIHQNQRSGGFSIADARYQGGKRLDALWKNIDLIDKYWLSFKIDGAA